MGEILNIVEVLIATNLELGLHGKGITDRTAARSQWILWTVWEIRRSHNFHANKMWNNPGRSEGMLTPHLRTWQETDYYLLRLISLIYSVIKVKSFCCHMKPDRLPSLLLELFCENLKWCATITSKRKDKLQSQFRAMVIHFDLGSISFVNSVIPVVYHSKTFVYTWGPCDCCFLFLWCFWNMFLCVWCKDATNTALMAIALLPYITNLDKTVEICSDVQYMH